METIMDTPIYTDDTGMSILEVAKEIRSVEDEEKEIS